jgi:hypothetical protein
MHRRRAENVLICRVPVHWRVMARVAGMGQWAGGRGVLVEGSCRIGEHGTWGRQWRIG